jgi:MFS family permease
MQTRRRFLVLGICCMSLFIVSMDTTVINVALPSIGEDFGAQISGLQWTIDAYIVVLAVFSCCPDRPPTGSADAALFRPGWSSSGADRCCAALRPRWNG